MVHKLNSVFLTPPAGPSVAEQLPGNTSQTSAVIVLNWKLPKISTTVLEQGMSVFFFCMERERELRNNTVCTSD